MNKLLAELRRRNVVRVAVTYVVLAWVLLQAGDVLFGILGLPDFSLRLLFGILALGLPVAILLAWIYEITPEGVRRDQGYNADPAYTQRIAQRLNVIQITLLLVAIGLFSWARFAPPDVGSSQPATTATTAEAPVAAQREVSIAVLPFEALSSDPDDAYFGKGIAEELLNALAQLPDLKVAGRTSSFAFEDTNVDLREIGRQLGVSHVLEGSVRSAGDRLRITAQLNRTDDGSHVWSETYDRTMTDVFEIQDEIVRSLSRTLQIRLGIGAGTGRAERGDIDPQAYEQYLRGLALWGERDDPPQNRIDAVAALHVATQMAPNFIDAWAALANAYVFSAAGALDLSEAQFSSRITEVLERASEIDPDHAALNSAQGYWKANYLLELDAAREHHERALALAPNRAQTHYAIARYWELIGDVDAASVAYDRAVALDPLNQTIHRIRAFFYIHVGRMDEGIAYFDECARIRCLSGGLEFFAMTAMLLAQEPERAVQWFDSSELIQAMRAMPRDRVPPDMAWMIEWAEVNVLGADPALLPTPAAESLSTVLVGFFLPRLAATIEVGDEADAGAVDYLFASLEHAYEKGQLFSEPYALAPFYGYNPTFPDWVRSDPRYHALWERPGMPELAAARRANGWEHGLPIP